MKKLVFILIFTPLFSIYSQCKGNLIFRDEFDGSSLDLNKWNYETGNGCPNLCGWGNNERQFYTNSSDNVYVSDGLLNISLRYSPNHAGSGSDFTSGKINTRNKFNRLYGRFEARMKMPAGLGLWPAFWMLPVSNDYGGWPTSGEIDIMEYRGDITNKVDGTVHYGNAWPGNLWDGSAYYLPSGQSFATDFYEFAIEWAPGVIRWYVNGNLFKTITQNPNNLNPASNNAVRWPWDKPFYMILNLAMGGWYAGNPSLQQILNSNSFPAVMQVDYVRVYDMTPTNTQLSFTVATPNLPGRIQAENYNIGCNGVAYSDNTPGNNGGGTYRTDDVDLERCTDAGGGFNVGWTDPNEWLNYQVNVTQAGNYNFTFRVATELSGKSFHISSNGQNISGNITVPTTGGWQTWQNVTVNNVPLSQGVQTLRIVFNTDGINLNYFDAALVANQPPNVSFTSPSNNSSFCLGQTVNLTATASDPDGSVARVEFRVNNQLVSTLTSSPYQFNWTSSLAGSVELSATAFDNLGSSQTTTRTITVNTVPTAPAVTSPVSYCQNATATALSATGTNLRWYTTPTGGTASTTAPTPSTTATGSTTFYVSQTNDNNCESPRASITVTVNQSSTWYKDLDGDGFGYVRQTIQACTQPNGYVSNALDKCPTDPNKINPGNCGCNKSETECLDCKGTPNGVAYLDNCQNCVLSQIEECKKDCYGDWGGTAIVDSCGDCVAGNMGLIAIFDKNRCLTSVNLPNRMSQTWVPSPNPFQYTSTISKKGGAGTYKVFNSEGELMDEGAIIGEITVGDEWKSGLYLLTITEDGKVQQIIKLIKE